MRLAEPPERLTALLREHDRLLEQAARRKRDLDRFSEEMQRTGSQMAARLAPLLAAFREVEDEIHATFAGLLAPGRLPRRTRGKVQALYQGLQEDGVLQPRDEGDERPAGEAWNDRAKHGPDAFVDPESPPPGSGGFTASRPAAGGAAESLRALFRRLAGAMHPDKVQHEEEKSRRTEAMKELTRAYEEGDLARLLELEKTWFAGETVALVDEIDQRCAALERTNEELRTQLRGLARTLRDLRRSEQGRMLRDLKSMSRARGVDPIACMVAEAEDDLRRFRAMRDFVRSFSEGKITVDELLAGAPGEGPDEWDPGEVADLLFDAIVNARPERKPTPRKSRRSRAAARTGDVPF